MKAFQILENKIKLSTDPKWFGAEMGDYKPTGPVVDIPIKQLVGFEPEDKMNDPKSKAKVDSIAKAVQDGKNIPPIVARKYKSGYQVIDGHHRFWGQKKAGADSLKAQIVPPEDIEESLQLKEFGGRVVPGVNTTPDVGPDAIKKQAAKFGFKVNKDGYPQNHPRKIKGPKTNVAFNLGLAESTNEVTAKELSSDTEIYVDMDGVLVDFFGEWTKMMGVSDWKQIKNVDAALQKIRDTEDFWINLKPTPNADKLLGIIKKIKGEYNILSAPMTGDPRVEPSKREWIKKNLTAFPPKKVIITVDKQKYATQADGTPNILIDDFGKNIAKWEASGGVGFKHKDHKFERTAQNLAKHFKTPAESLDEILGFATHSPKRATRTVKRRPPEEDSVRDKIAKRRAAAARGDKNAFSQAWKDPDKKNEGDIIPNPTGGIAVDTDAPDYDFMKMGRNLANPANADKSDMNPMDPDLPIFPYSKEERLEVLKALKKLGYEFDDIGGYQDTNFRPGTDGEAPPQIKGKDTDGQKGVMKLSNIKPVQRVRDFSKLAKQYPKVMSDSYEPLVVDRKGRIVNGHHRYDSLLLQGKDMARVVMLNDYVESITENFADGKKKGKSRPGRVKKAGASCKGSVSSLRAKARKYGGEKGKMYHWCANMKGGKKGK